MLEKITSKSNDGLNVKELVFNESIILASKDDSIEIRIDLPIRVHLIIVFRFDEIGEKFTSTINNYPTDDSQILDLTLHKWNSTSYVENSRPLMFLLYGNLYLLNFKTYGSEKSSQRTIQLSLWRIKNG